MPRGNKRGKLERLFSKQNGICAECLEPAFLDSRPGVKYDPLQAVRMRAGSGFDEPGTVRPGVMVHKKCAQRISTEAQAMVPIEELRRRSNSYDGRRHYEGHFDDDDEFVYCIPGTPD